MTIEALQELMEPLAFAGMVMGTAGYYALIRRRKRQADEAEILSHLASNRRARARFRHLRRHDGE